MINELFESDIDELLKKAASKNKVIDDNFLNFYSNKILETKNNPDLKNKLEYIYSELKNNQENCNDIINHYIDVKFLQDNKIDFPAGDLLPQVRILRNDSQDIQDFINIKNRNNFIEETKKKFSSLEKY